MNEVLDTIKKRFSCRYYTEDDVAGEQLKIIAEAGAMAPSAHNRKPWRILVITDRGILAELEAEALERLRQEADQRNYDYILKRGGRIFYGAPCVILVVTDKEQRNAQLDGGMVGQNMVLAATSLDLGTVYCGFLRQAFSGDKAEDFRARLGIPGGFEFCCAVVVGHPAKVRGQLPAGLSHISYLE